MPRNKDVCYYLRLGVSERVGCRPGANAMGQRGT